MHANVWQPPAPKYPCNVKVMLSHACGWTDLGGVLGDHIAGAGRLSYQQVHTHWCRLVFGGVGAQLACLPDDSQRIEHDVCVLTFRVGMCANITSGRDSTGCRARLRETMRKHRAMWCLCRFTPPPPPSSQQCMMHALPQCRVDMSAASAAGRMLRVFCCLCKQWVCVQHVSPADSCGNLLLRTSVFAVWIAR